MKKTHKLLLLLAIVCTLLVCCMMSASAYYTEGIFQYTTNGSDEATIIDLIDNDISGEVVIPETIGGYTVTAIEGTFVNTAVTSVVIPDTVKTIGSDTFMNSKVEKIDLGNGVTTIYDNAFTYAPELVEINIPASVELIVEPMARECPKLQNITVDGYNENYVSIDGVLYRRIETLSLGLLQYPTGRTATHFALSNTKDGISSWGTIECIYTGAFAGAYNLKSIGITKGVKKIFSDAFVGVLQGDLNIADVYYEGTEEEWNSIVIEENNDTLNQATKYYSDTTLVKDGYKFTITVDGGAKIVEPTFVVKGELVIPDTVGGYPVQVIGNQAFRDCTSLTSLIIPDGVKIDKGAFSKCTALKSVTFMGSAYISGSDFTVSNAFYGCENIDYINIKDLTKWCSEANVGNPSHMFNHAKSLYVNGEPVTEIAVPYGVTKICNSAFRGCQSITSVAIPDSVKSIGNFAFEGCTGLTNVKFGDSVGTIGSSAFKDCICLSDITFNNNLKTIGDDAFSGCTSITSLAIPDSVDEIGSYAFKGCSSLISVKLPYLQNVLTGIFQDCTSLTSITIPSGRIWNHILEGCTNLTSVTLGYYVRIDSLAFAGCSDITIFCHTGTRAETYAKENDIDFVNIHFYEEEWTYNWNENVRTRKCEYCDYIESEALKKIVSNSIEIITAEDAETGFVVEKVENKTDDRYELVVESLEKNDNKPVVEKLFDITLENNEGVSVQPDNIVMVKLPISKKHTDYKVYRVNDDGTYTDMNAEVVGEYVVFTTEHFSLYVVADIHKHDYAVKVIAPTCTDNGYTSYKCNCGNTYTDSHTANLGGHADNNHDGRCDKCKTKMTIAHTDNNHDGKCDTCKTDTTVGCSCRCHKNDFIWKFLNFFYKLFKMNHYCACGKAHY